MVSSLGMSIFLAVVLTGSGSASGFAGFNFGLDDVVSAASSCLSAKDAETCKSLVEEGTGDRCVWCTCSAVPSECLGSSLAKKLPQAVFSCDFTAMENGKEEKMEHDGIAVDEETMSAFEAWKERYLVSYPDAEEENHRLRIFAESLRTITTHNEKTELEEEPGVAAYVLGLNRFADMAWEEFQSTRLGFYGGSLSESQNCSATHVGGQYRALGLADGRAPPAARDWRELGAVSIVKDQDHCGSCWTFSTTGCLESHHYLRTGKMILLSEQQLVDCAQAFDNHGCNGGLPSHAFEYIAASGGLDTEEAYPYVAEESGSCSFAKKGVGAEVIRSVNITFQDEAELLEAVGNMGPVSVAFQVASDFKAYDGGVYDNPDCSTLPDQVNHAVLAVGYDTTPDGVDYWIIKNSWGTDWGIDGYFHMVRGKNMCGIADCAAFPLVP